MTRMEEDDVLSFGSNTQWHTGVEKPISDLMKHETNEQRIRVNGMLFWAYLMTPVPMVEIPKNLHGP
jgi:hypothetical protein